MLAALALVCAPPARHPSASSPRAPASSGSWPSAGGGRCCRWARRGGGRRARRRAGSPPAPRRRSRACRAGALPQITVAETEGLAPLDQAPPDADHLGARRRLRGGDALRARRTAETAGSGAGWRTSATDRRGRVGDRGSLLRARARPAAAPARHGPGAADDPRRRAGAGLDDDLGPDAEMRRTAARPVVRTFELVARGETGSS